MSEHRYHPDAARQRTTTDNEPDPEDEGATEHYEDKDLCDDCGGPGVGHEGPYPGLCTYCTDDVLRSNHADDQIAYMKEGY